MKDIWKVVISDMEARRLHGLQEYGKQVSPHSGEDFLQHAYEEVLDQAVYLRALIEERMNPELKFTKIDPRAIAPSYATEGDSGLDLYPVEDFIIPPGEHAVIPTGISIELPTGYEAQVRSRSGLAAKYKVHVLNSPGTIDNGYRGEIKVILINHGSVTFVSPHKPDGRLAAIAQLVIAPVTTVIPVEVSDLSDSQRGTDGFGSSDLKV